MTNREKKQRLWEYLLIDREIDRLIRERSRWMARATHMTSSVSDMPRGGGTRHATEDIILRIAGIETEINNRIDALLDVKTEICEEIGAVDDRAMREVLELRYLDGETFEAIAEEMGISVRHALRLHGGALEKIFPDVT